MLPDVIETLFRSVSGSDAFAIRFPDNSQPPPELASVVSFPRIEFVIEGEVRDRSVLAEKGLLREGDAIYIPGGKWNLTVWQRPAILLSILFSKEKLGFSLQFWDGEKFTGTDKQSVPRLGPRVGSFLLQTMNEIVSNPDDQQTARCVVAGLLSHCQEQLANRAQILSRSGALFEVIKKYIEENASLPLTRENVAKRFHITPNYLSHLFRKSGNIGFSEYLNHVRLERAKLLLKGYELKIKEVATSCGFVDSNYFCRVFRKSTARSPSQYRSQWLSQLPERKS
ncbi:AraC family transcriptional regulator [Rahnella woolbedingensis]|uniref:AraC family transcriptional regulator n=1 Tax=Rahnella woolbedingensis TaxID=1510574 RepID=A0A419N2L6_9GAMM|nr:AraC family transcriptional regulator [Rahnella woolbedingensis]RJT34983.1 AraC family transcriptional regulator [Rahnella woolbedingensis]